MARLMEAVICSELHSRKWWNRNSDPGFPEPRPIQKSKAHSFLCVDVRNRAQRVQGLGGPSKGSAHVIRTGPLLFGFTSNKDNSRETEAPHFPSLKTKERPKIGVRKHLIPMCQMNTNILPTLPSGSA